MVTDLSRWVQKRIKDVGEVVTGSTPSMQHKEFYDSYVPWITAADFLGKYVSTSRIKLSEQGAAKARVVPKGSVLVTCIASIGLNAIADVELSTNQQINSIIVNNEHHNEFIYYLIQYHSNELRRIAGKTAVPILNKRAFENYVISCPDITEQRYIAKVLSSWDQAIMILNKLITAKQKFRKALMQKLLTGQARFPGFGKPVTSKGELPEGWKHTALSQIADIIVSNVDKKTDASESAVHLCNYMDVYKHGYIDNSLELMKASASTEEIRKFKVRKLDILITKDSETPDDIGVPAIITEEMNNVLCGYHLAIIRCKPEIVNPLYLFMAFNGALINEQWKKLANGVTRFGLAVGDIEKIAVLIPIIGEQSKISNLLFKLDQEITLLSEAKVKLHKQRDGLMSMLLNPEKHNNGGVYG